MIANRIVFFTCTAIAHWFQSTGKECFIVYDMNSYMDGIRFKIAGWPSDVCKGMRRMVQQVQGRG